MKKNTLQFGKAMSAALFVLLLSVAGMKNALAQTQVATLQHGDDISVFYGANAFVDAHTAAETGDIITLSSGSFMPTTITKAITLRGAGFVTDTVLGTTPTVFSSAIVANVADTENYLTIEGIRFSSDFKYGILNNAHFYKCYFESFYNYYSSPNSSQMADAQFVNCRMYSFYVSHSGPTSNVYATNTSFINSVVWYLGSNNSNSSYVISGNSIVAMNSFIRLSRDASAMNAVNSIITYASTTSHGKLTGSSFATNCIGIRSGSGAINVLGSSYTDCWIYNSLESVFESFTGSVSGDSWYTEPLILLEEITNTCLGTDGTQVGIHGGIMPYSNRPSYMVLKRCNVANKSTIDGKLSVEIEVVTEE